MISFTETLVFLKNYKINLQKFELMEEGILPSDYNFIKKIKIINKYLALDKENFTCHIGKLLYFDCLIWAEIMYRCNTSSNTIGYHRKKFINLIKDTINLGGDKD